MNSKGGIKKAFEQFRKDLKESPEYIKFKKDSVSITFEDRVTAEPLNEREQIIDKINVLRPFKVTTEFFVPDVNTKETRDLNKKILKKYMR